MATRKLFCLVLTQDNQSLKEHNPITNRVPRGMQEAALWSTPLFEGLVTCTAMWTRNAFIFEKSHRFSQQFSPKRILSAD